MEESERRFNKMVDLVNHNRPKSELVPPIQNKEEDEKFDRLVKQLAEQRKKNPNAMLSHVDSEWGPIGCGYNMDYFPGLPSYSTGRNCTPSISGICSPS